MSEDYTHVSIVPSIGDKCWRVDCYLGAEQMAADHSLECQGFDTLRAAFDYAISLWPTAQLTLTGDTRDLAAFNSGDKYWCHVADCWSFHPDSL